jgi:hypothetical protein
MTMTLLSALLVYALLAAVSIGFNAWLDGQPRERRPDGMTAALVVVGVAYTLLGGALVVGLTLPELLGHAATLGAATWLTVIIAAEYGLAFVASGAPMVWGEMLRSYRSRATEQLLDDARRVVEE